VIAAASISSEHAPALVSNPSSTLRTSRTSIHEGMSRLPSNLSL
jgi:hypothetical protein